MATRSIPAGSVAALIFAAWRARVVTRPTVLRSLEHWDPRSRNVLTTADEMESGLLAVKPHVRARLVGEAATLANTVDVSTLYPLKRPALLAVVAAAAWALAFAIGLRAPSSGALVSAPERSGVPSGRAPGVMHVTVTVRPPSYTHLPPQTLVDPAQVAAIEHSTLGLSIRADAPVTVDLTGDVRRLSQGAPSTYELSAPLIKSGYALVTAGNGERRMIPIAVTPDALPAVRLTAPGRDLVYGGGNPSIRFDARATDDFGLSALTLRYTKVSGSGEQFEFKDGEILRAVAKDGDRAWTGTASRTLSELAMAEGDMLVYRAVAADMRPDGEAASDAFFIEISKLGVAAGDAFTLPEQETRYALSQQMLIVKTDRLNQRRPAMSAEEFTEASQGLAVEQRMIRSEFVFMLGGEIEDEEVEAEQSVEIQAGRLANRGQRDIRAATVAMSQAEKLLTAANTADALKAERAAVEALQRAFARDRYILRALATRSQLDLARRLTGAVNQALGWRRLLQDAPDNRRAALLQSALEGLGEATTPQEIAVLSALAIRIDPESAPLRQIAADLQRLADVWTSTDAAARRTTIDSIAAAIAVEARRTLADAPAPLGGAR